MLDRYKRNIEYLRISVTDRCNLRCIYCMPEQGVELMDRKEILSLEEITEIARVGAMRFGIKKIRFTGGEPLVRKGIVSLVKQISTIEGIEETTMTTNGVLLSKYAADLKKAGLTRVNISCDSLSPVRYHSITRIGNVRNVLEGIRAAREAMLIPIKINVVRTEQTEERDIIELQEYCQKNDLEIQLINEMNFQAGIFSRVEGGRGGHCEKCNRLRLLANGDIKPCLFSELTYNVRDLGIEKAFLSALENKPKEGKPMTSAAAKKYHFYNIGG